jgi:DNA uptake protein ComE-like DNA-binding protein
MLECIEVLPQGAMKIGPVHGYAIDGDRVLLNAELAPQGRDALQARSWTLQLWACEGPHAGGPVSGLKIAEAPIELPASSMDRTHHLHADAFAHLPPDRREYAIVLVLASDVGSASERIHDYANYPARQPFFVPHMEGAIGYEVDGDMVTLRAARVVNPRAAGNLSGSLVLELRALTSAARSDLDGYVIASAPLGRLGGQSSVEGLELRTPLSAPLEGGRPLALVLAEYTAEGFVARDAFQCPIAPAPQPASSAGRVSIQSAAVDELARVPGITRKLAIEIVKARPFAAIDELVRVRGIGEKTLRRLRDRLEL